MAFDDKINHVIKDCRGSVMVEVALFVPAIMFLLLAGVTLTHVVQLDRTTDRIAAVLADEFSQKTSLSENDFDTALMATTTMIGTEGFEVASGITIKAIELHPVTGMTTLWSRYRTDGGRDCSGADPAFTAPEGQMMGAGILYLIQVDLCTTPGDGFFLSSVISVLDFSIHARAVATGRGPALRRLQ
ncbi:TadE/TadG family type IV pilus assembly protein [Sneathiella litorea]|uniref:Pilus assembly protein n=1 Tax=Sneathiella litorea TaxID=2606216 RepID=A0A6L8W9T8_9PROT|nr:hypothetical protein [Sneathiella litorea]MZR31805.1 hypothetical protein [Sneathiella litorea]